MSELQTTLLNSEYFPSILWYQDFLSADQALIDQYENFVRTSGRNRCHVNGPNGKITLTVPLLGGRNQRSIMKDICVANQENWQHQHWGTLDACYRRSPYFEYFEHIIKAIFQKKYHYLLDLNIDTLTAINLCLKIKKEYKLSTEYVVNDNNEYLDLRSQEINDCHEMQYIQPFQDRHGFVSGLSCLDMIFCAGAQTLDLLSTNTK